MPSTRYFLVKDDSGCNLMLIRFTVENFLSFKDEIEFSMVPGRARKHREHVYHDARRKDLRLLKTGVIYGANASGKTNLIKAMDFAQELIVNGRQAHEHISSVPFLLDQGSETSASKFMFEIKIGAKCYSYRFEVDTVKVIAESLTELRPSSEQLLFERKTDDEGQARVGPESMPYVNQGDDMFLQFTAKGTRPNQLFLTETIQRNIGYFEDVYNWFRSKLSLLYPYSVPGADIGPRYLNNEDGFREKYRDLIQLYDLDIEDIDLQPLEVDAKKFFTDQDRVNVDRMLDDLPDDPDAKAILYDPLRKIFVDVDKYSRYDAYRFVTIHYVPHENRRVYFELVRESDGTVRLFELTPALIRLLSTDDDTVLIIDELDRRLHAQMTRHFLDIFLANSEGKSSQLVVTTHESGILDLDLLRRDEIWFIEKDQYSASQVYSLEEFAPRHDMDIEKGYLRGRFGAIPILPSYNLLEWAK